MAVKAPSTAVLLLTDALGIVFWNSTVGITWRLLRSAHSGPQRTQEPEPGCCQGVQVIRSPLDLAVPQSFQTAQILALGSRVTREGTQRGRIPAKSRGQVGAREAQAADNLCRESPTPGHVVQDPPGFPHCGKVFLALYDENELT
ncbi:hypothetical protein H920_12733 [Fukomys damarensis]|uniref:Uncharacterized protein n=1 Tax=Fukomys damarensis TaxID=885580 RepID=A0A091D6E7_FUKDA|nr:hypothetical protein H920_12733 [Fukomys damarensis]